MRNSFNGRIPGLQPGDVGSIPITRSIMENKKVIFLDVDGVLNYTLWYIDDRNPGNLNGQEGDLDPLCIERINKLCEETGAEIVLSSDWRINNGAFARLERAGLHKILDKTPITIFGTYGSTYHFTRGEEIQMWLEWHPEVTNYVILDDRTDFMEEQLPHFVHVNSYRGLTEEDYQLALNILSRCPNGKEAVYKTD